MHTAFSLDAFMFGTRATPDEAYEFAKGKPFPPELDRTIQERAFTSPIWYTLTN